MASSYTILNLGDSYTIGEMVSSEENFPNQTVRLLRRKGYDFASPVIIARTGWTTDELRDELDKKSIRNSFDFVTLLIGVNNQYRGRSVEDYQPQFDKLLQKAIRFANGKTGHVIVLSIPDWGVTPFAKARLTKDRSREQISKEIDAYNIANKEMALAAHVHYIDITPGTRIIDKDPSLITADGLHPSGKEYAKWAEKLSQLIGQQIQ